VDKKELLAERRKVKTKVTKLECSLLAHNEHLAKRLADPAYRIGAYVTDLGAPAVGPCCLLPDREARDVVKAAIRRTFPEGAILCHRCDTPECIEPAHIFPGTHQDNMRDCALKGRWSRKVGARKEALAQLRARLMALELALGLPVGGV
jgi:hypothetical protein